LTYFNILIPVPSSFIILYNEPIIAQLNYRLSHSYYMFRYYFVILKEFEFSTLPSYTSISNAILGNTVSSYLPAYEDGTECSET